MKKILKKFIHPIYLFAQVSYGHFNSWCAPILALPPLVLRIRITSECDLSCSYCYLNGHLNQIESNHLSLEEWKKIAGNLPRWTIIDITGAEPFRAKNFKEVLEIFLDRGFKISLITNGQTVDEEIIDLIVKKKIFYMMVSIDGLEATHNLIRGNSNAFQKAKEFCHKLSETKKKYNSKFPTLCIKTSLLENNLEEFSDLQNFVFEELSADQQTINLLFQNKARGGAKLAENMKAPILQEGNTQSYSSTSHSKLISALSNAITKASSQNRTLQVKPPMKEKLWSEYISSPKNFGVKNCSRPHSVATLYYDGTLTPCDMAVRTGNVRELNYQLKNLWRTSAYKSFYKDFKAAGDFRHACEGCALTEQCKK
jgi:radical SAM protein with 4Fe4S-binding SPASM domain